jgi:ferredoxin-NADP reductase
MDMLKMRFDGPHGVGSIRWGMHPVTALIAGGVGITPGISIASHIIQRAALPEVEKSAQNQWYIHLLWIVKEKQHTQWFEDELKRLVALAADPAVPVTLNITIHYTGAMASRMGSLSSMEISMEEPYDYHGPGTMLHGRPDLPWWFGNLKGAHPGLDVAVNVCGPRPLVNDVRRVAANASGKNCFFYVEEEVFEF